MRISWFILLLLCTGYAHADTNLTAAIENVRTTCGNISAELTDMKKMAGITTAVTGVGTVAGGVALGSGITKAKIDTEQAEKQSELDKIMQSAGFIKINSESELLNILGGMYEQTNTEFGDIAAETIKSRQQEISELEKKSKNLGNWRTGMLATSTATNIAGAVMSGANRVKGDLKQQINECLTSVKTLSNIRMQARLSQTASDMELERAEKIIRACDAWTTVDVSSINTKSTGATISSGIGATTGLAGTIVSASANSNSVRDGDADKEKKLNTTANVLAGGTTLASGVATIFNATQISAIKRAATVADECEGALK